MVSILTQAYIPSGLNEWSCWCWNGACQLGCVDTELVCLVSIGSGCCWLSFLSSWCVMHKCETCIYGSYKQLPSPYQTWKKGTLDPKAHSLQCFRIVLTYFELLIMQLFALCTTDCPNCMDCIVACSMTSWVPKLCRFPGLGWHLAPHKQTYPFHSPLGIFSSKVSGSCDLLRSPVDLCHHRWVLVSFSYPSVCG